MNQLNPGNNSDVLPHFPVKRKRGRPRKDQSLNRREGPQVPPGFKVVNRIQPLQLDAIEVANDGIVGQTVTGVVEAVFDDGYLLNVRIGNSNTNLRGVIFKPGHYVPLSAENDVAPHVQMIRRNEIPLQMENHTHMHARHPQSKDLHGVPTGYLANRSPPGIRIAPQTADLVASKGKHVSPVSSCVVPFVGGRGTLVPVVLQPVSLSNGFLPPNQVPQIPSQVGHLAAPKHIQVQTVPSQVPHLQPQTSHQVPRVDVRNENGPFHQGAEVLYGEQVKSMKQIGVSLETHIKNNMNEPLVVEPLQAIHSNIHNHSEPVPKPSEKNRIGRMSELLQAMQENMREPGT